MVDIGEIEEVFLRKLWPHEAHDFTPWLAENLSLLGSALGLSLELTEKEAASGGYSLDILAKDTDHDCNVVIENQLGFTDHGHLGQLITYATHHDARIAIWVSSGFQPEHRAAINWLNKWMSEEIDFYAVEVRSIRIDGSLPAVEFHAVAYPEWWDSSGRRGRGAALPETIKRREFFEPLVEEMKENEWQFHRSYAGHSCQYFKSGFDGILFGGEVGSDNAKVHIWMNMGGYAETQSVFDALFAESENIESALEVHDDADATISWKPRGRHSYADITVTKTGINLDDESTHGEIREWLRDYLNAFYDVFKPHLERITGESSSYGD